MGRHRKIIHNILTSIFFLVCFFSSNWAFAQNGEALFKANCASCHKVDKDFAGPALKGWKDRVPEGNWIYDWIHNPAAMIAKDPFAKELFNKWKPTTMTAFPALKNEEIDAILKYVDDFAVPTETPGGDTIAGAAKSSDNSLLYGILTLILAIVALVLFQINRKLRDFSDKEIGIERSKPLPFFRNKAYMMTLILALFA
ncbi:MAG: cytochrome c, partial [Ferruginibacter sp.]